MKLSVSNILSVLFLALFSILIVGVLNVYSVINRANDYHETVIAEIEASNFSSSVINAYTANGGYGTNTNNKLFKTEIVDRSVLNEDTNLEKVGRIYEVKTSYKVTIPILNYNVTKTIQGFAR